MIFSLKEKKFIIDEQGRGTSLLKILEGLNSLRLPNNQLTIYELRKEIFGKMKKKKKPSRKKKDFKEHNKAVSEFAQDLSDDFTSPLDHPFWDDTL